MIIDVRDELSRSLGEALEEGDLSDLEPRLEINEHSDQEKGDVASPIAFEAASMLGEAPPEVAERLLSNQDLPDIVEDASVEGGYINYHLDDEEYVQDTVENILGPKDFGEVEEGDTIVEDVSSPNIAKPLHIGHLRNTLLGDALGNILEARGHEVIRDNHIGDWGGQFGNLMYAFKANQNGEDPHGIFEENEVDSDFDEEPIDHLLDLYQAFGQKEAQYTDDIEEIEGTDDIEEIERIAAEYEVNPEQAKEVLEDKKADLRSRGRKWFEKLEEGDEEAEDLWKQFKEASISRFEETYDRLGVEFDEWIGESFYVQNGWTDQVVETLIDEGIARKKEDGSVAIDLAEEEEGEDEFVVLTSDGTTLYPTRDIAAAEFRQEEFDSDQDIYVVASEQDEYFQDLFDALGKMGRDQDDFTHVSYGMISLPEGSMSTRRGQIITAREVLDETYDEAKRIVSEKRPEMSEEQAEEVAEKVALGAVKFENVNVSREKDITFDMDRATSFEEASGPYVQYAATRADSILEEVEDVEMPDDFEFNDQDLSLAKKISQYPLVLESAEDRFDPSPLANYLLDVAAEFNTFYAENQVLDSEYEEERLALTEATYEILEDGMNLLGIDTIDKM